MTEIKPAFKDFDIVLADLRAKAEGLTGPTFQLLGETFKCRRKLSGLAIIELGRLAEASDMSTIMRFLELAITKADYVRFNDVLLTDEEGDVSIDVLADVVGYLVEAYTGRPSQESSV